MAPASHTTTAPSEKIQRFLDEERPATPFVVVDTDIVAERYLQLVKAVPTATVYYAVKANPAAPILERLNELGSRFDVASPAEIDHSLAAGALGSTISYGNTIKKRRDIAYAASCGVRRYTVDSREELDKVLAEVEHPSICVRLFHECTGADWPLSRKFGCDADAAMELLVAAAAAGAACGLSFHVGSQQRNVSAWESALEVAAGTFERARQRGATPNFINLGGGLPGTYRESMPGLDTYGEGIVGAMDRWFGDTLDEVMIEPGRYLVADAGVLRTEVVLVSRRSPSDERRWVYLDCGKFHGLAETMDEAIRYRLRTPHDGTPTGPVVIAGPTCDSADVLYDASGYELPDALTEGDYVDILSTGAYTTTYSSTGFNGFPALAQHYI
jgi:ornithine decarboxylase